MSKYILLSFLVLTLCVGGISFFTYKSEQPAGRGIAPTALGDMMPLVAASAKTPAHAEKALGETSNKTDLPVTANEAESQNRLSSISQIVPVLAKPIADWRAFKPEKLTVVPVAGLSMEFTAKSITSDGKRTIWVGTNSIQGAMLVASGTRDLWDAIVTVPGADEYSIQITPDHIRVTETPVNQVRCSQSEIPSSQLLAEYQPDTLLPPDTTAAELGAPTYEVDLMLLYTPAIKNALGGIAQVENRAAALVAAMNGFLNQSQVDNFRWRLVGLFETPSYPRTYTRELELACLLDSTTELGHFAADKRDQCGADQVALFFDSAVESGGRAEGLFPSSRCVVVYPGSDSGTLAHELAHNFGCMHDRLTCNAVNGNGIYSYGHRFQLGDQEMGTIMSYAGSIVPYFSNPDISYVGVPVGVAVDQPRAANNARWIREHAAYMAGFRPSTMLAPAITTQPATIATVVGNTFNLEVTATGTDLRYQWALNGVTLLGATSSNYTKRNCNLTDTGSYTVTVSNILGSVTSTPANVTVDLPAIPAITVNGSVNSHNSGGGAFSGWSLALLTAALAARVRAKRRPSAGL